MLDFDAPDFDPHVVDEAALRANLASLPLHRPQAANATASARGSAELRYMQFGVQFFPCVSPEDKSAANYFEECLAIAEEAETLGYSHARTVEHYFRALRRL